MNELDELIRCAQRELSMREKVYPHRVANGKMSEAKAQHEIEMMGRILEILEELKKRSPKES